MTEKLIQELIQTPIESAEIMKMLPHRYPFLLIDRVMSYTMKPEKTLTAIKNVSINEPFFRATFPQHLSCRVF